jgi:hypothetical protein
MLPDGVTRLRDFENDTWKGERILDPEITFFRTKECWSLTCLIPRAQQKSTRLLLYFGGYLSKKLEPMPALGFCAEIRQGNYAQDKAVEQLFGPLAPLLGDGSDLPVTVDYVSSFARKWGVEPTLLAEAIRECPAMLR